MDRSNDIQKELEQLSYKIAPYLEELKNDSPYQQPFNYFDGMQEEVFRKLEQEISKKELSFWEKVQAGWNAVSVPWAVSSMAIIALLLAGIFLSQKDTLVTEEDIFASVDIETIESLVELNIESFDSEELIDLAYSADLETVDLENISETELLEELLYDMDEEEIINLF